MRLNTSEDNYAKLLSYNQVFEIISSTANDLNQPTYVIGGFVRDLLLKRDTKDIDIVTLGSGIDFAKKVAQKLNNQPGSL